MKNGVININTGEVYINKFLIIYIYNFFFFLIYNLFNFLYNI